MTIYCVDCKHCTGTRPEFLKCARTLTNKSARDDLVSPALARESEMSYCSTQRSEHGDCGPDAKLFEAKEKVTA